MDKAENIISKTIELNEFPYAGLLLESKPKLSAISSDAKTILLKEFLKIAKKTIKKLGWDIFSESDTEITVYIYDILKYFQHTEIFSLIISESKVIIKIKILDEDSLNKKKNSIDLFLTQFEEESRQEKEKIEYESKIKEQFKRLHIYSFFLPKGNFFFTPILININIFLFFMEVIFGGVNMNKPSIDQIIHYGGLNFNLVVNDGQYWRLLTSMFLHIGFNHLFSNMVALLSIGWLLEKNIGKSKFIFCYFVSGIIAGIISLTFNPVYEIAAGASGAIFGLFGNFYALINTDFFKKFFKEKYYKTILYIIVMNIFTGITNKGIDNSAHLGGLISGFLLGIAFYISYWNNKRVFKN